MKEIKDNVITSKLPIINEKNMHMGQVEIRLSLYNQGSAQDIKKSIGMSMPHSAGENKADNLQS